MSNIFPFLPRKCHNQIDSCQYFSSNRISYSVIGKRIRIIFTICFATIIRRYGDCSLVDFQLAWCENSIIVSTYVGTIFSYCIVLCKFPIIIRKNSGILSFRRSISNCENFILRQTFHRVKDSFTVFIIYSNRITCSCNSLWE